MARSLRDELLKVGLVTSEQASRAERGSRPRSKPARKGTASRERGGKGRRAARLASGRELRRASERPSPVPVVRPPAPAPDPEEQVKRLNVEIRRILDTEAEKIEAETDTPFHFLRGERLKRLYVSDDQRRRLTRGELAIVGFRGRHHLVPRLAGERVRELRPEVFVFMAAGDGGAQEVEAGYEGYEVPDELVW